MKLVVNGMPGADPLLPPGETDPFAAFASETAPPPQPLPPPAGTGRARRLPRTLRVGRLTRRVLIATLCILLLAAAGLVSVREFRSRSFAAAATGRLTVTTNPAGAEVLVDGTRRGMTPLTLDLPRGPHKVTLRTATASKELSIESKPNVEVAHSVELVAAVAPTGALSVSSDPPGLRIALDGVIQGTTPAFIEQLTPGAHRVALIRKDGSLGGAERSVLIQAGGSATLHVAAAAEKVTGDVGSVTVTSPIDVQLFEGETLVGSSRAARLFLPAGTHTLTAVNESLEFRRVISVDIKPGAPAKVAVPIPNGALSVNARPWAEVFVDGKSLGETPIGNYALPIGTHELVLRHPQLGERRQTVVIAVGRTARVGVDLKQ